LTGYTAVNAWILYDLRSWIVTLAGPVVVVLVVWAGCTLARLLHESWERIRIALETAGLRHEMDLAKRAQEALIPREPPGVLGLDAVGWTMPASTTGGDCFDLWKTADGRLGILLADASGHGLGPAMIVTQVRTLVRALCEFDCDPHRLLGLVNARLNADLEGGKFVTAFLGFLSTEGELKWSSAGHGPVFIRTQAGAEMLELQPPALPLGIMPDWEDAAPPPVAISTGGLILLCSDGIFEAAAPPDKEMFGVPRMVETIEIHPDGDSTTRVTLLSQAVQTWYAGTEPLDDQTIVIVRRT
jgi:serine phosphatase RsbU (regulator of sigma subunit)